MTVCKMSLDSGVAKRNGFAAWQEQTGGRSLPERCFSIAFASVSVLGLGACINVAAPEEPIVIELNINIRAEVLYRLAEDANNTIEENADIF